MFYIILSTCFSCVLFNPDNNCRSRCTLYRIRVGLSHFTNKKNYSSERLGYLSKVTQLISEQVRTQTHVPLMAKLSTTARCTSKFSGEMKASAGWHCCPTAFPSAPSLLSMPGQLGGLKDQAHGKKQTSTFLSRPTCGLYKRS